MSELIRGSHPEVANKKSTRARIKRVNQEHLGTGLTEGTVHRVDVEVIGAEGKIRTIPMAEKMFDNSDMDETAKQASIAKILAIHHGLLERGLPTIPTMRTEKGNNNILMTDLTHQNKNEVVSLPDWAKGKERSEKYADTEHKTEITNLDEISNSLATIFEQSVATGCKINMADAFFFVIDKENKKSNVLLADLAEIEFVDVSDVTEREKLADHNYETILQFVRGMRSHIQSDQKFSMDPILKKKREFREMFKKLQKEAKDDRPDTT